MATGEDFRPSLWGKKSRTRDRQGRISLRDLWQQPPHGFPTASSGARQTLLEKQHSQSQEHHGPSILLNLVAVGLTEEAVVMPALEVLQPLS